MCIRDRFLSNYQPKLYKTIIIWKTYLLHARRSPLALGPLSSYKTRDLPMMLFCPDNGKLLSVNNLLLTLFEFSLRPAIDIMPIRSDSEPTRQNPSRL